LKVSIIGTTGIPANYGGFETLVENLARCHAESENCIDLVVFCSRVNRKSLPSSVFNCRLEYLPLSANGISSIPYDIWSIFKAVIDKSQTLLVMGVSGALVFPIVRVLSKTRIVVNIDGIEWRRPKWGRSARAFLRLSEWLAVTCSDLVVADNKAIADYVYQNYGVTAEVIPYGGDHVLQSVNRSSSSINLPSRYIFSVCRIEPENNIELILSSFSGWSVIPVVIVGNWDDSHYGRELRRRFGHDEILYLLDPIYDGAVLGGLRAGAHAFVHGHSAGGTNPSLVEAMHYGKPIFMFDCSFNRHTTEGQGLYFSDIGSLRSLLTMLSTGATDGIGHKMKSIAKDRYTWKKVAKKYFDVCTCSN
jgi:glycosyltransferase involved in cell wall biosynthesis